MSSVLIWGVRFQLILNSKVQLILWKMFPFFHSEDLAVGWCTYRSVMYVSKCVESGCLLGWPCYRISPWVRLGSAEQFPFFCSHDYAASQQQCCHSQMPNCCGVTLRLLSFWLTWVASSWHLQHVTDQLWAKRSIWTDFTDGESHLLALSASYLSLKQ